MIGCFVWGWEGDPSRESVVTITLRETGGNTELTLRQEGLGSVANRDDHGKGWNSALDKAWRRLASGRGDWLVGRGKTAVLRAFPGAAAPD